jgi:crotonobetainyl-CoA:carnitine CoA-transferase CaiB-like acyl-CoA transferase
VRGAIADKTAGMYAAVAICAELAGRGRNAPPRTLKIPMLESLAAFTTLEQLGGATFAPQTGPVLYPRTASPDRRPYATVDGHLSVLLYTDRHWASFLAEIGRDDLRSDARFATLSGRTANIDEVYAFVADQIARRSTGEWVEVLERIDVPHARVNSIPDLFSDAHLAAVDMFPRRRHPTEGPVRIARAPFLFDDRPLPQTSFAQRLGAATDDFIAEHPAAVGQDESHSQADLGRPRGPANGTGESVPVEPR